MRVLEIGKFYPPQRGGMETALRDLCRGLAARRHEVLAVVAAEGEDSSFETIDGVRVWRVANWGTVRSVPICPSLPSILRRALQELQPDLVHLHLPHPWSTLAWSWVGGGHPFVVSYHSDIVRQRWLGSLWSPWRGRILRRATAIHVTSEALRDGSSTLQPLRDRCHVIPFGVDIESFRNASVARVQTWTERFGQRFALFVGRLVYYKGVDVLLEALRGTTIPCVIVGDGPMRQEWETLSRVLGLQEQVHFVGEVSDESRAAILAAASIFVLPSSAPSETFGLVQLEAMASGLPVIACRASDGVASVHLEGETGLLVPPRDPDALRAALVSLWEDPERGQAMARAALERVRAFFSLDRSLDRFEALFDQVLSGRSTTP